MFLLRAPKARHLLAQRRKAWVSRVGSLSPQGGILLRFYEGRYPVSSGITGLSEVPASRTADSFV